MTYSLVTATQKYTKTIYMKIWETEFFALNFKTGELEGLVGDLFLSGDTMGEAQKNLNKADKPHLRLTGDWYNGGAKRDDEDDELKRYDKWAEGNKFEQELDKEVDDALEELKKAWSGKSEDDKEDTEFEIHWTLSGASAGQDKAVEELVKEMSIDEFIDWLDEHDKDYILKLLKTLDSIGNLDAYIKTIEGHLTHKYGGSKENDEEDLKEED